MWTKTQNGESIHPPVKELSGDTVIVRRNFRLINATEEMPEHYEYEEWQMSAKQYEIYQNFEDAISEQNDALIELAGLISEVME